MKDFIKNNAMTIEWTLGVLAVILPAAAWLSGPQGGELTLYDIFPPLGLAAFGLMWTHFVMGALRRYAGIEKEERGAYMIVSMGVVLALILLHPGLLWLALFLDGYGLPPLSYMEAYAPQLGFVALGTLGLTIFLAFELKRFFGKKEWWKYVEYAQVIGMAAIFVHAIGLGRELRLDWFMLVWIFYGVTLALSIIYSRWIYNEKEETNARKV